MLLTLTFRCSILIFLLPSTPEYFGPFSILRLADAVAIQNGVVGTPNVNCEPDMVMLEVETEKLFTGNIFVKGRSNDEQCSTSYLQNNAERTIAFKVPLGHCNMRRRRSPSPRGMNFMITIVVSFHPMFITKVDRAYHIKCFYKETESVVTAELDVSVIPTTDLFHSMGMPTCSYSVHAREPNGPELRFANIGDTVYHVWSCEGVDVGMMVKKCSVEEKNGIGRKAYVVDYNGCSIDPTLLGQISYDASLMRATAESHVFKYADSNSLYFSCEIRICQKMLGGCDGISPPICDSSKPPSLGVGSESSASIRSGNKAAYESIRRKAAAAIKKKHRRSQRDAPIRFIDGIVLRRNGGLPLLKPMLQQDDGIAMQNPSDSTMNVNSGDIIVLDIDQDSDLLSAKSSNQRSAFESNEFGNNNNDSDGKISCIPSTSLALALAFMVFICVASSVMSVVCYAKFTRLHASSLAKIKKMKKALPTDTNHLMPRTVA